MREKAINVLSLSSFFIITENILQSYIIENSYQYIGTHL